MVENQEGVDTKTYLLVESFGLLKKIRLMNIFHTNIEIRILIDALIKDIDKYLTFSSDKS